MEDLTTRQNPDIGAKISEDVLSVGSDTLFPLQAALGYDIAQNLFVGGYNLVVEGPSDLVFISTISDYLETNDRVALDPRWTIIPVGGADKIPTFAALLGAHVDFTVLVDEGVARNQRLQDMIRRGLLDVNRLISVGQITDTRKANIEDLFTPDEYVQIYNEAYGDSVEASRLEGTDSIIRQIEREKDADFSHLRPASVFLRNKDTHLGRLSEGTLQRFENLFRLVNNTMSES